MRLSLSMLNAYDCCLVMTLVWLWSEERKKEKKRVCGVFRVSLFFRRFGTESTITTATGNTQCYSWHRC
jgi:hypothetical protein